MLKSKQGTDQVAGQSQENSKALRALGYLFSQIRKGCDKNTNVGGHAKESLFDQQGQPFVVGIGIDIVVQKSPVDPVHGVTAPLIERIIEAVRAHTEYLKQESLFSVSKNR